MTRRTRGPLPRRRFISSLAFAVSLLALVVTWPTTADAARIAQAYTPGVTGAALGGDLVVNSYGVTGLGLYRMTLDDGSSVAAVCIQADVSHSTAASYQVATPTSQSGALDYLTWRYLRGASGGDVQAAGVNLAAWAITGARRSVGGTVWQGGALTVAVLGVAPRDDIESSAISLLGEGTRRRGPWALTALPISGTTVSVRLAGPGGPISNEPVSFVVGDGTASEVVTNGEGVATFSPPDAAAGTTVRATANGPGRTLEYTAPGSQRVAVAGPPARLEVEIPLPAASTSTTSTTSTTTSTTSTTTTSSTTTTTTTTTASTSTSTTTVPVVSTTTGPSTSVPAAPTTSTAATTTTTVPAPTTTATTVTSTAPTTTAPDRPPDTTEAATSTSITSTTTSTTSPTESTVPSVPAPPASPGPPDIPATGSSSRAVVRIGALLFALGSIATYVAAGSRRNPVREVDLDGRDH